MVAQSFEMEQRTNRKIPKKEKELICEHTKKGQVVRRKSYVYYDEWVTKTHAQWGTGGRRKKFTHKTMFSCFSNFYVCTLHFL